MPHLAARARTLLALHAAPEILIRANVRDVVSATVVAGTPGVRALATASHSIAVTFGYEDGENIPLELHLGMVERIVRAVDVPVTMDVEGGYGDAGETARRAIAAGVVGGTLEDQLEPLDDAVVDALGPRKLTGISVPGASLPARQLQELGVARVSTGPFTQRVALTALRDATAPIVAGGTLPESTLALN
jgi:2-methylisocitrate lyase-like PEP mutase family enzyme